MKLSFAVSFVLRCSCLLTARISGFAQRPSYAATSRRVTGLELIRTDFGVT
jgi:hypothetical protein